MASALSHVSLYRSGASLTDWLRRALVRLIAALLMLEPAVPWARDGARVEAVAERPHAISEFGKLFDAVVERITKSFWDKQRLAEVGWEKRAAEVRQSVIEGVTPAEAAGLINALLAELKTSHTGLLTPDDIDYYILLDVFSAARGVKELIAARFGTEGVRYAGIGLFSVRIDGRDFVDAVLEGSPAEGAGLKVGDEIVGVDGAAYHPIRSFKGKVGQEVMVAIRRAADGPVETVTVRVASIAPLEAFGNATQASARVIERDGRRIGYVRVWASVGRASTKALTQALQSLDIVQPHRMVSRSYPKGGDRAKGEPPPRLDGLIIDMRGRIGGTGSNATRYLEVIDPRGPYVRSRGTPETVQRASSLRGRTAVLIDHRTRSTAELFVHAYKRERQGPLIGTRTAGAVSAAAAFAMPGGNLLYLAVAGLEVDGEVLEGPGVAPDIEVPRPVPYSNGADPVLDAAAEVLAQKAEAGPQPKQTAPSGSN